MERLHTIPYEGPPVDYEALRQDIREYVANCRKYGLRPDAFAFSLTHKERWGRVPGRTLTELIAEIAGIPLIVDNGGFDEWLRDKRRRSRGEN